MAPNPNHPAMVSLSKLEARRFILAHHHLWPPRKLTGKQAILEFIQHLGCVQFDTINVVGRNADLVLQSRVKGYTSNLLDELLYTDRLLIDGWDKLASIYLTSDWPYFSRRRKHMSAYHYDRSEDVVDVVPEVLAAIEQHGPISSLHFKDAPKTDWFWSATSVPRAAMETLFAEGRVGISHRVNTRRSFDLIENLVPEEILAADDPNQSEEDYHDWHLHRRVGSMGLAAASSGEHWLGITNLRLAKDRAIVLDRLVQKGRILNVEVEGLNNQDLFIRTEDMDLVGEIRKAKDLPPEMAFIAPLDNLIWNRKFIGELFEFNYVWEVYKPQKQREYGYYVLPVLYGDAFAARVDMKLDRKTNVISVLNWWWEPGFKSGEETILTARECFGEFRHYLGADGFQVDPEAKNRTFLRKVVR
jgi:uncharacterized protein YcaQ